MKIPFFEVTAAEFDKYEAALPAHARFRFEQLPKPNLNFMWGVAAVRSDRRTLFPKVVGVMRREIAEKVWNAIQSGAKPDFNDPRGLAKFAEAVK